MSKMGMDRKPPLPRSPTRLRSRRFLRSNSNTLQSVQTPPGSLAKSEKLKRTWGIQEKEFRPEYHSISCELRSLAKMAMDELRGSDPLVSSGLTCFGSGPMFERGRFYDEYSARRNERLKRKKREEAGEAAAYDLGVTMESSKKLESPRKPVAVEFTGQKIKETPRTRYMLRSSTKENKRPPPLSVVASSMKPSVASERKGSAWRTRKV
ncbi:hypothetical protein SAY86_016221 [Trapa natans]|uniref:Uncharacterized protein n=1 Tax=Trapa natans TaxID=22666 RepID=A0AAN7QW58_TRANT|nr:hypothetical protein SAY86_016221 [Trapa natans]